MNRFAAFVSACCVAALVCAVSFAELTAEKTKEAQALIAQFSAKEFAVRQAAVDKLIEFGPDVMPLVRKTMDGPADAEVRLRCQMTLKGIAAKFGVAIDGDPAKAPNYGPSLITMDLKDASLADALEELAAKSGNSPIVRIDPSRVRRRPEGDVPAPAAKPMVVTLSVKDKPYWEVLDMICRPLDLCYDFGWEANSKVRIRSTLNKADEKSAYCGPAVVKLDAVTKSETVTSSVKFRTSQTEGDPPASKQVNVNFQLRYFVEDRLPILSSWIEITKATTTDGVDHIAPGMREQMRMNRRGYSSNQGNVCCGQSQFYIQNEEAKIDLPLTLQGKVSFEAAVGRREMKVPGLRLETAAVEKSAQVDGLEIRLTNIEKQGFNVKLSLELSADAGVPIFIGGTDASFGFVLVDSKGKVYKNVTQFEWKTANGGTSGGNPAGYRLDQYTGQPNKPMDGKLTLTFTGVRTAEGDWSLVLVSPERLETKDFPFAIKDIPAP